MVERSYMFSSLYDIIIDPLGRLSHLKFKQLSRIHFYLLGYMFSAFWRSNTFDRLLPVSNPLSEGHIQRVGLWFWKKTQDTSSGIKTIWLPLSHKNCAASHSTKKQVVREHSSMPLNSNIRALGTELKCACDWQRCLHTAEPSAAVPTAALKWI